MVPIPYDLLAIWDQNNGLATALHGQCGLDKIIALEVRMYSLWDLRFSSSYYYGDLFSLPEK